MILENKELLDSLFKENLLKINRNKHERTWEYYYKQYHKVFYDIFLEIAKQKRTQTNRKFMPFLFVMRHSLELFLKKEISNIGIPWDHYGKTHNLTDLYPIANINEAKFLEYFDCLNCNSEGDCWRYISDKDRKPHFGKEEKIKAFEACDYYCCFLDNGNSLTKGNIDPKLQEELTFHMGECDTLGIVGTQYDFAIIDILHAIKYKQISINDVYLPLLFLLRHCLEIRLKFSIMELGDIVEEEDCQEVYHTHSVKNLYDILAKHINPAIESIPNPNFKRRSEDLRRITEQYKDTISSLDTNSFLFRFPKDRKGNDANFIPESDCVSKILELYRKSYPFLYCGTPVLSMSGVLKIGVDKEIEYYE
ncbi:hypothetical protein [Porphyromonas gingivicanis]|uniref:hypothetical protein n=1 Tax=Porphyromonas gingivicanis TaxID=266762 RepID=UPI00047114D5|nr:hypothetical protein [Porphyromonas gingivicanis]